MLYVVWWSPLVRLRALSLPSPACFGLWPSHAALTIHDGSPYMLYDANARPHSRLGYLATRTSIYPVKYVTHIPCPSNNACILRRAYAPHSRPAFPSMCAFGRWFLIVFARLQSLPEHVPLPVGVVLE